LLLVSGCVAEAPPPARKVQPTVLLVSVDGLRADVVGSGTMPTLDRMAAAGVHARWMTPSYPSLTFPNHYTLVTGLRPDHHGVVNNTMHDPALGWFTIHTHAAVGDPLWWGGEPVWVTLQKRGGRAATMYWPGSEAEIHGVRPSQWALFDAEVSPTERVDQVLTWLDAPLATRPRMMTLYFDGVDSASHAHGPGSPQTRAAIAEVDAALGHLLDGLRARGQLDHTNLIIVSDHGMAEVPTGHAIAVEDMVTMQEARVISIGQVIGIAPNPGFEATVENNLLGAHDHYDCWRRSELPERWHYGSNPRIPPIVCQMREGWDALPRELVEKRAKQPGRGSHGFDPALLSMRALFIARGPAFAEGKVIAPFDNVEVYPLLARLFGIPPAANDGEIAPLLPALRTDSHPH